MKNLIRAIVPEFRRLFRYILIVSALVYDWKGVLRFFIIGLLIRLLIFALQWKFTEPNPNGHSESHKDSECLSVLKCFLNVE